MKYITIVRSQDREMTDDCHTSDADALAHAARLVSRLDLAYSVAVVECDLVTNYQFGNAIFYQTGAGADWY